MKKEFFNILASGFLGAFYGSVTGLIFSIFLATLFYLLSLLPFLKYGGEGVMPPGIVVTLSVIVGALLGTIFNAIVEVKKIVK